MTTEYRNKDRSPANPSGDGAGVALRAIYLDKARAAGLVLDPDDLAVLDMAAATADNIADLDASIAALGVVVGTDANPKTNPALTEVRQQRLALARLMAVVDQRITAANGGTATVSGGQGGVRGVYTGDGSQNQKRDRQSQASRLRGQRVGA